MPKGSLLLERFSSFLRPPDWLAFALVPLLLRARRPPAVIWRVRSVVVDAIDGVCWRGARPNVRQKGGKIVPPSLAHNNPAATVIRVIPCPRVVAAVLHLAPRAVLRRLALLMRVPEFPTRIDPEAAATPSRASNQEHADRDVFSPAFTQAKPPGLRTIGLRGYTSDDAEPAECLSGQVERLSHSLMIARNVVVSHRLRAAL